MVSDQEIARGVEILLRQSQQNAAACSVNGVVQQLGAKLGLDLSHKAAFIQDQINLLTHHYTAHQPPSTPPSPPPPVVSRGHFSLQHHHSQFPSHHHHHHPQQQQQLFASQFGLHIPGFPTHAPLQHNHAPPFPLHSHHTVPPPPPPPKNSSAISKSPKESPQSGAKRRGGAGGLNKLCGVSPELQAIVGEASMARTEIVKQLWVYIRKHNLQDPSNKRKIICNEALRAVFEIDCTDMFKMNKLLAKHILPLDPAKVSVPAKRQKVDVESTAETSGVSPIIISDALALFLGTTIREMLPSEVMERVWEYIKVNNLEDPSSKVINCDAKLKDLFGCESIPVHGINDILARLHLSQTQSS